MKNVSRTFGALPRVSSETYSTECVHSDGESFALMVDGMPTPSNVSRHMPDPMCHDTHLWDTNDEAAMTALNLRVATIHARNRAAIGFRSLHRIAYFAIFAVGLAVTRLAGAHGVGEELRPVLAERLDELPGRMLHAVVVTYAPGGRSLGHHHPGSVFAYVLSGAIRSENSATGPARVYRAGEAFFEPASSRHLVSENASQTESASLLAVLIAPDGAVLTTDEP